MESVACGGLHSLCFALASFGFWSRYRHQSISGVTVMEGGVVERSDLGFEEISLLKLALRFSTSSNSIRCT